MNKESELVSVVIPIYNSAKFLQGSINSVLNQTYKNIEVIVIDDGSTDSSVEILNQYSNEIRVVSQKNQGLGAALNAGIKNMSGRWFKWFSPDDVMYPHCIETLINAAKILPENTIIYSNWEIIDEKGKKLRDFSESNYNDLTSFEFNVRLLDGQQINVNTSLIPSFLFNRGCTIRQLSDPVAIDYDFFLRACILFGTKFNLIEKNLVKYRIHTAQLSHKNIAKTLSYLTELRKEVLSNLDHLKQKQYQDALIKYKKSKPIFKKTMKLGLDLVTKMPSQLTDQLLIFYLNEIRSSR